jgi:osmoprotectant transport system permease protein
MKPLGIFLIVLTFCPPAHAQPIVVGSKRFTESYVLGEIAKTALRNAGFTVEHKEGMGGTIILWQALVGGEIALYPEYTGTIGQEILKTKQPLSTDEIRGLLREKGVGMPGELGFATNAIVGAVPVDRLWHAVPSYPTISEIWLRLLETFGL